MSTGRMNNARKLGDSLQENYHGTSADSRHEAAIRHPIPPIPIQSTRI